MVGDLAAALESVLFVAAEPVSVERLSNVLGCAVDDVEAAARSLAACLEGRGIRLQRSPDGFQLVSAPEHAAVVERFLGIAVPPRLSAAALETLAVIAYRQPVHRLQIEEIRGVNSERVLRSLLAQGLIQEVGRAPVAGRPVLYGTTEEFLQRFGLTSLDELPPLESLDGVPEGVALRGEELGLEAAAPQAASARDDPSDSRDGTAAGRDRPDDGIGSRRGDEQGP